MADLIKQQVQSGEAEVDFLADVKACPLNLDGSDSCEACQ